jgi:elongation factor 1-alpha
MNQTAFIVAGNVDSGKSTLIGVLINDKLDDGKGSARGSIAYFPHERETGRTSSCQSHMLKMNDVYVCFYDLCGHQKYLRNTARGIIGPARDYAIILIAAGSGLSDVTRDHIQYINGLRIPIIIIITKIDLCPENILNQTISQINKYIIGKIRKEPYLYREEITDFNNFNQEIINGIHQRTVPIIPVICISNKTGYNINFLKQFIASIKSRHYLRVSGLLNTGINKNYPPILYIEHIYLVNGIGIVLAGIVKFGSIMKGQKIFIGPRDGKYIRATVKTIHNCESQLTDVLHEGESGSISIRCDNKDDNVRNQFKKGFIATTDINFATAHTVSSFLAKIVVGNHSTTIRNGYEATIYCGAVVKCGSFKLIDREILRIGETSRVSISFVSGPGFILPDTPLIFINGGLRGIGKVDTCYLE